MPVAAEGETVAVKVNDSPWVGVVVEEERDVVVAVVPVVELDLAPLQEIENMALATIANRVIAALELLFGFMTTSPDDTGVERKYSAVIDQPTATTRQQIMS